MQAVAYLFPDQVGLPLGRRRCGLEHEEVVGIEAEVSSGKPLEGDDEEPGVDGDKRADGYLHGDHDKHEALARIGLHGGGAQNGHKSEEQRYGNDEGQGEEGDASVDWEDEPDGGISGADTADDEGSRPPGEECSDACRARRSSKRLTRRLT